jgi:putative redox protein
LSNIKTAHVSWTGNELQFEAVFGSGYKTIMSGQADEIAGSPMEFLLGGVAGCTAIDVVSTLNKMRQVISSVEVKISGKRADDYPMVYTEVELLYIIRGEDVSSDAVERAINLSKEKYCSASIMFQRAGVTFSIAHQIEQTAP